MITNNAATGNSGDNVGGGIDNVGTLTSQNDTLSNNTASGGNDAYGGGVYNSGTATLTNDLISGNQATASQNYTEGGGIFNTGTLTSLNNQIFDNTSSGTTAAGDQGGGIFTQGVLTSTNDAIYQNEATTVNGYGPSGGGVQISSGSATLTNDTISGNSLSTPSPNYLPSGGGIYIYQDATVTLTDTTVTGNSAPASNNGQYSPGGGAGIYLYSQDTLNLANSIVALNTGGGGDLGFYSYNNNVAGTINAHSSLIGDNSSGLTNGVNGNIVNPSNQNIFATSGVANNGGPTPTIALAAGSPAIGAGGSLGTVTADNGNTLTVNNTTFLAVGDLLRIGSEIVQVTAITSGSGTSGTLTVTRAQDGTTQANLANQSILLAYDQRGVTRTNNDLGAMASFLIPAAVAFENVPSSGTAGLTLSSPLTVAVLDAFGTVVAGNTSTVTLTVVSGPGGFASGSTTSVAVVNGVATFSNLAFTVPGTYTLMATDGTLASAVSTNLVVNPSNTGSTTIVVNSLTDDTLPASASHMTLRDAIAQANTDTGGDTIVFAPGLSGTITLNQGELDITNSMTIEGPGASALTICGNNASGIFEISSSTADVGISGLTLTGGQSSTGGGAIYNAGTLASSNNVITNNAATGNSGDNVGGGIDNVGTLTSQNDTLSNNTASGGNDAYGGGVYNSGTATLTNDLISGNQATASQNYTEGGGIFNTGTLTSLNNQIFDNTSSGTTAAGDQGGGIFTQGVLTSTNDAIYQNEATTVNGYGPSGGGVQISSGSATLTNDTISGNSLSTPSPNYLPSGGGIYIYQDATVTLTDTTVTGNSVPASNNGQYSPGGGAGIYLYSQDTLNLANSIVALNTGGGGDLGFYSYNNNVAGTINAHSSLIGDNSSGLTNGVNGNIVNPSNQNIFATSGVANNGGPTPTIALAAGSPAIGAGGSLGTVTADNGNTLTVNNTTFLAVGDLLRIGSEIVQVTAITSGSGTSGTLTVTRRSGWTTQANLANQSILLAYDQRGVTRTNNDLGAMASFLIPAAVAFENVPSSGTAGLTLSSPLTVAVLDAFGTVVAGNTSTVTLTVVSGPGGFASGSTTSVAVVNGVATFSNLAFTVPGTYTLMATDGTLASAVSTNLVVNPSNTGSTTIVVNSLTDDTLPASASHMTLRDAIAQANTDTGGDTIVFAPGLSGTITLNQGELDITNSMTIEGPGASTLTISGNNASGIFDISSSTADVSISGLTLTGGQSSAGGGAIYNAGTLASSNNVITNNAATGNSGDNVGGGIDNVGTLTSQNDTLSNNTASGGNDAYGGGVYNSGMATLEQLSNVVFQECVRRRPA